METAVWAPPEKTQQPAVGKLPGSTEQTVERGRELAALAVEELIEEVQRRAAAHQLDRGLRLSLPYFDDRRLSLRRLDFTVIPTGRILFVPAFVVIAVERQIERVQVDRQYTESTRQHVLALLGRVCSAFRLAGGAAVREGAE